MSNPRSQMPSSAHPGTAVRRVSLFPHGRPERIGDSPSGDRLAHVWGSRWWSGRRRHDRRARRRRHDAAGAADGAGHAGGMPRCQLRAGRVPDLDCCRGHGGRSRRAFAGDYEELRLPTIDGDLGSGPVTGINDIVLTSGLIGRMALVEWCVDGQSLGELGCDGVIVSTSTGSTAYNLSAGGPVLAWGLDGFVVSFVSPHSLHARSMVLGRPHRVELHNRSVDVPLQVIVDGTWPARSSRGAGSWCTWDTPSPGSRGSRTPRSSPATGRRSPADAASPRDPEPGADRTRRARAVSGAFGVHRRDRGGKDHARPGDRPAGGRPARIRAGRAARGGGLRRGRVRAARRAAGRSRAGGGGGSSPRGGGHAGGRAPCVRLGPHAGSGVGPQLCPHRPRGARRSAARAVVPARGAADRQARRPARHCSTATPASTRGWRPWPPPGPSCGPRGPRSPRPANTPRRPPAAGESSNTSWNGWTPRASTPGSARRSRSSASGCGTSTSWPPPSPGRSTCSRPTRARGRRRWSPGPRSWWRRASASSRR